VWVDDEAPFCSRTHCSGGLICAGVVAQLAKNAVLKNINLEKNCVNQEGATSLAQGLAKNTGVRVIDLMNQKNCRCLQPCHAPHSICACHCTFRQCFFPSMLPGAKNFRATFVRLSTLAINRHIPCASLQMGRPVSRRIFGHVPNQHYASQNQLAA
jgi:hypothetical protein